VGLYEELIAIGSRERVSTGGQSNDIAAPESRSLYDELVAIGNKQASTPPDVSEFSALSEPEEAAAVSPDNLRYGNLSGYDAGRIADTYSGIQEPLPTSRGLPAYPEQSSLDRIFYPKGTVETYTKNMSAADYERFVRDGELLSEMQKNASDPLAFERGLSKEERLALQHQKEGKLSGAAYGYMRGVPFSQELFPETAHERKAITERYNKKIEEINALSPGLVKSWRLGDITVMTDRLVGNAVKTGNSEVIDNARRIQVMAQDAQSADAENRTGMIDTILNATAAMLPAMVRGAATGAVTAAGVAASGGTGAIPAVAGGLASGVQWYEQGKGSTIGRVMEKGGDPIEAAPTAMLTGALYSAIEYVQVGQLAKTGVKVGKEALPLVRRIASIFKEKGIDFAKETGEEVVQGIIEDEGVRRALKRQGFEGNDFELRQVAAQAWETVKETAGPMGLLSLAGAGVGAGKAVKQENRIARNTRGLVDALSEGYTLKDKASGKEFTPPKGAAKKDVRNAVRRWAYDYEMGKNREIEIVPPQAQPETETETPEMSDEEWANSGTFEGEDTETPIETQGNATRIDETAQRVPEVPLEAKREDTRVSDDNTETAQPEKADANKTQRRLSLPAPSEPINTFKAWQSHIAQIKAWADRKKADVTPQITARTEQPAPTKQPASTAQPAETELTYQQQAAKKDSAIRREAKKHAGENPNWGTGIGIPQSAQEELPIKYRTAHAANTIIRDLRKAKMEQADINIILGNTNVVGRKTLSDKGIRLLDRRVHSIQEDGDGITRGMMERTGAGIPEHRDDLVNFLQANYMNSAEFGKMRNGVIRDYWYAQTPEGKATAANAEKTEAATSAEAWRVFGEEPESLTAEQRTVLEAELETNLRDFIQEQVEDVGLKDSLFSSPAFEGNNNWTIKRAKATPETRTEKAAIEDDDIMEDNEAARQAAQDAQEEGITDAETDAATVDPKDFKFGEERKEGSYGYITEISAGDRKFELYRKTTKKDAYDIHEVIDDRGEPNYKAVSVKVPRGNVNDAIVKYLTKEPAWKESDYDPEAYTIHYGGSGGAEYSKGKFAESGKKGGAEYSFIGNKGAAALDAKAQKEGKRKSRLDDQKIAEQMEKAGKNAATIKMATGWERGDDGLWRYEMSDFKIKADLSREATKIGGLWRFVDENDLFTAYPELLDVTVSAVTDQPPNAPMHYNPRVKGIEIDKDFYRTAPEWLLRSGLIHEIQHAIQDIEGFSFGANTTPGFKLYRNEAERIKDEEETYRKYWSNVGETEARNVEVRVNFTDEERRASLARDTKNMPRGANKNVAGKNYITEMENTIKVVNARFNRELQQQIKGFLPESHVYKLGNPGEILQSAGMPNLPIELRADLLAFKARDDYSHPFNMSEIKNLPYAINDPIAVFAYGDKSKAVNVVTELEKDGKKFLVGISLNPEVNGENLNINSIRTIFPKDTAEWQRWIEQGKALYINDDKIKKMVANPRSPGDVATEEVASAEHGYKIGNPFFLAPKPRSFTSETPLPQPLTNNIGHSGENVNTKDKKSEKKSGEAGTTGTSGGSGGTTDGEKPADYPSKSDLKPVEMPELVKLVRRILGVSPQIRLKMPGGARGMAVHKDGVWHTIRLAADLPKNMEQAIKTLAHEIGHVMSMHGGDGKLRALFTKITNSLDKAVYVQLIGNDSDAMHLTKKDVRRIWWETTSLLHEGEEYINRKITEETPYTPEDILSIWNKAEVSTDNKALEDYIKGLSNAEKKSIVLAAKKGEGTSIPTIKTLTHKTISEKYREAILKEAEARRLTELKTIYDELYSLSKEWRPFQEGADAATDKYRQKGEEVFADAMSVFLNDPDLLMEKAPNFWRVFNGWEGRQNPFREVYKEIQDLIGRGEEDLQRSRLNDVYKAQDKGREQDRAQAEAANADAEKRAKRIGNDLWTVTKSKFLSRSSRLGRIERALEKAGVDLKHDEKATVSLSDTNYSQTAVKEYTAEVIHNIGNIFGGKDRKGKPQNGWESKGWGQVKLEDGTTRDLTAAEALGAYMALRRMATERAKIFNRYDKESAEKMLAEMKRSIKEDKYGRLEEAAKEYNRIRQEIIIPELERSGAFGEKLLKKLKENDVYATFKVVFEGDKETHNGSYKIVGIKAQIGTLLDVGNAFTNTVANDIDLISFAKQNKHKLNVVNIMKLDAVKKMGYTIEEAEKNGVIYQNLDATHRTLQTVHVSENGVHKAYNVDKVIANIMSVPTANNSAIMKVLRWVGQFHRDVFVNFSLKFQVKNPLRDIFETVGKNPELMFNARYWKKLLSTEAFRDAWALNSRNELRNETGKMLRGGALNAGVYNRRSKQGNFESELERDLGLLPLSAQERKARSWLGKAADWTGQMASPATKSVSNFWNNFTGSLEMQSKIAGYEGLKAARPEWSERELAYNVRKRVGTPDALERGEWTPVLNELFLFSNVNFQGTAESLKTFQKYPLQAGLMVAANILFKAPMFLAKVGLWSGFAKWMLDVFGWCMGLGDDSAEEVEDIYNKTLSYYKKKYYVFPTGLKFEDGTPAIITVPRTFFGEITSTIAYETLEAITKKRFKSEDFFNVAGDLIPYSPESTQPMLQIAWAFIEWATGKNPEDMYRNRKIIPRNIHGLGRVAEAPYMAEWAVKKELGTEIPDNVERITEYATGKNNLNKPLLDNLTEIPILGPVTGVFIRRADGGKAEAEREAKAERALDKKRAKTQNK